MKPAHNRFQSYDLDSKEEEVARSVNPYTYAFLQNKIAAYALAALEFEYNQELPFQPQAVQHERLKAQVQVLEELMTDFNPPLDTESDVR